LGILISNIEWKFLSDYTAVKTASGDWFLITKTDGS